ncbi:MAG: dihydropteroate synthase [Thermodesulfobacteriota bacterium]
MGILNVTPDSFSDGGRFTEAEDMARQVAALLAAGADIIDIGGESSRPFSEPVSVADELARVLPAIRAVRAIDRAIPISIDTTKAEVAHEAIAAGATIINDISALRFDPSMAEVAAQYQVPVILMHMLGTPKDMQVEPRYADVVAEILAFLAERIDWAASRGIRRENLIVDPGIGFGKSVEHNLSILKHLHRFRELGCPLLLGHSRKAFIGRVLGLEVAERDIPTAALAALAVLHGVDLLRVHNVPLTRQAVQLAAAVEAAP